jgi:hypothetical protein
LAALLVRQRRSSRPLGAQGDSVGQGARAVPVPARDGAAVARRPVRTMVPRLVLAPAVEGRDAAVLARHPPRLEVGSGELRDRRERPGGNPKLLAAELRARIKRADEEAQKCIDAWGQHEPALEKGVMLAFTLDARGLDEVWIEDHPEVPSGALACLSNALYPIDWGGLTSEPIKVTTKHRYARDAGAAGR